MDISAHFMIGIWFYQKFGNMWAIPLSIIFDIDHFFGYVYDKRKRFPKKVHFLLDMAYRPGRTWIHSITILILIFLFASFFVPWSTALICLAVHLLMDAIDKSGILLFPPFSKKKISGPLPVSYIWDNPIKPTHNKKGHLPGIIFMIIFILLIFFRL
jgi:hypothetical protein